MKRQKDKGSILVLTVVSVLLLSVMVIGLLTTGDVELMSAQNQYLNRVAYYTAIQGMEEIRNLIYHDPTIEVIQKSYDDDIHHEAEGMERTYMTGSLWDLEYIRTGSGSVVGINPGGTGGASVSEFNDKLERDKDEYKQLKGKLRFVRSMSLDEIKGTEFVWNIKITSMVTFGRQIAYSEISAGILTFLPVDY
jgi:hypothetical protein